MNPDKIKIQVKNLTKDFGSLHVLQGVTTDIHEGEVVVVIGPSGSGTSTFLRCLNFLERADKGEMTFDGRHYDLAHADKREIAQVRMHTGFVFQTKTGETSVHVESVVLWEHVGHH